MRVCCKAKSVEDIKSIATENIISYHGADILILEKEYAVMGIMVTKNDNSLHYLIDEEGFCYWIPSPLFEITNSSLPENWYVLLYDKKGLGDIFYISGFYELCNDYNFHDDLMEREPYAMETYFKRKIEFHEDL